MKLSDLAHTLRDFSFPKQFAVEITAECNLRCVMCYNKKLKRKKGKMPLELFQKCVDEVGFVSPSAQLWFSFGEPLLELDRLLRMVAYAKAAGISSVNLNTNGTLLTQQTADRLLDSGLDLVVVGVDGLSPRTYEQIRLGGNHEELYANINYLLERRHPRVSGPEIMVQLIEMDGNACEIEPFKTYWLDRGAIVKVRQKLSWGGQVASGLGIPSEDRIPCPWAVNLMHVFWDGWVPRCAGDTEGVDGVGNAWEESLSDLWGRLRKFRMLHLEGRFDELPRLCLECKDWMVGAADKIRPGWGPFAAPDVRFLSRDAPDGISRA